MSLPTRLPTNIIAIGRAVGDFELKSGTSKTGKPYSLVIGKMISGTSFVNVTESVPQGQNPFLPSDGDEVRACIVPSYKDDGLISLNVMLLRPDSVMPTKK